MDKYSLDTNMCNKKNIYPKDNLKIKSVKIRLIRVIRGL